MCAWAWIGNAKKKAMANAPGDGARKRETGDGITA
jgi:hypothetical protein